ncbi:hypothetical protein W97_08591 [Coniosporium apollinis CBS 100218]|uniref:Uncharacterized protein n=1 Tax=Coniosporium apollinis (strain CBS 100218) TaxID=1168221 RepID=R7Z5X6_CONA1|nr:uncharacterized protein W97_08591 [Coniosporium apollinis CBS 100218]EON69331.1 hypothetical protein W97_08591 [Coniosporium apollinis CBS 100218]
MGLPANRNPPPPPPANTDPIAQPSQSTTTAQPPSTPSELPPAALDLAAKIFDLARTGATDSLSSYLAAGIPPNLTNHAGDTLLMLAAYHDHASTVRLLVSRGADVNALNGRGQSPLAGAVFKGYEEVVRALVEAGADAEAGQPTAVEAGWMFRRWTCLRAMGVQVDDEGNPGEGVQRPALPGMLDGMGRPVEGGGQNGGAQNGGAQNGGVQNGGAECPVGQDAGNGRPAGGSVLTRDEVARMVGL